MIVEKGRTNICGYCAKLGPDCYCLCHIEDCYIGKPGFHEIIEASPKDVSISDDVPNWYRYINGLVIKDKEYLKQKEEQEDLQLEKLKRLGPEIKDANWVKTHKLEQR